MNEIKQQLDELSAMQSKATKKTAVAKQANEENDKPPAEQDEVGVEAARHEPIDGHLQELFDGENVKQLISEVEVFTRKHPTMSILLALSVGVVAGQVLTKR